MGKEKLEIFQESRDRFSCKVVDAQLDFVRGADGTVTSLVLHQGAANLPAPRQP